MPRHFVKTSNLHEAPNRFWNPVDPHQGNGSRTKLATRSHGACSKKSKSAAPLERSNAAADAIARERRLKKEYALWFAGMSQQEREAAHALGVRGHLPSGDRPASREADPEDLEFLDPADLPASSVTASPIDAMEPQRLSVEIEQLTNEAIAATAETFSEALTWALDGKDLIQMGRRLAVMVRELRPSLARGLPMDESAAQGFRARVKGDRAACGAVFGRALEWASRGSSVSQLGERLYLVAYVLRPGLIDARTLAALGQMTNKTRQAKDKLAGCLRDTFAGLQARTMRGETTRARCRQALRGMQGMTSGSNRLEDAA